MGHPHVVKCSSASIMKDLPIRLPAGSITAAWCLNLARSIPTMFLPSMRWRLFWSWMEIMVNILRLLMMERISPKEISYSGDDRHMSKNRVMETSISGRQDISQSANLFRYRERLSPLWDHPLYFSKLNIEIVIRHFVMEDKT